MAHKNSSNVSPYKTRRQNAQKGAPSAPVTQPLKGVHRKPTKVYDFSEANDRLYDLFKNHDFSHIDHDVRGKLAQLYQLLMKEQEHQNFTRLLTLKDVGIKHFIDSLIVPLKTTLQFPLMDLGTGPGFPGIPLKLLFPKETVLLAEGVQKRVQFLKKVRDELKLENTVIIGRNINPYFVYPVQGVITRAVEDISNTLSNVSSCLQVGGRVYFMKGPGVNPEIEQAASKHSEFYKLIQNETYFLPQTNQERRLVVYEKIKATDLPNEEDQDFPLLENE